MTFLQALLIFLFVDFIIGLIAGLIVKRKRITKPWFFMDLWIIKQAVWWDEETNHVKYMLTFN